MNEQAAQNEQVFVHTRVPEALAKFIVPGVLSQLAMLILNLTDTFFVGRTADPNQLAAMAVTMPLVLLMTAIATIFAAGGCASMAASLGAGDRPRAGQISAFAVYTAMILIAIISVLIFAFEDTLLRVLGADAGSYGHCRSYLLWVLHVGCVPLVFSQVISQLFSAEGKPRLAGFGILGGGVLNALLDPLFIFGCDMGIAGAGLATCIANYCTAIFFLIMYTRLRRGMSIRLHPGTCKRGSGVGKQVLAIGLPAGLGILLMNGVEFLRNFLIALHGTQADLAAWGVTQKMGVAGLQIAVGIALGIRPLIAYNYNAQLGRRTRQLTGGAALISGVYALLCIAVFLLFPEPIIRLFLPVEAIIPRGVEFLRIYSFCILGISFMELFTALFQAMGQWKIALAAVIVGKIVILIPTLLLMAAAAGVIGVVWGQPISDCTTAVLLALAFAWFMGKNRQRFS